ncbi:MAG: CRTAC1 family protein [Candidatus Solibacter usitatus]|nr:CRTAC1 family protein [Candidatus Solibacter usitatus]
MRVTWRQFAGCLLAAAACATCLRLPGLSQSPAPPIRFEYRPIPFVLENSVTPRKHLPETMPGGVAVFDFDNDGYPDIFFTNGAEMPGLQKSSTKFSNRLFHNNGRGGFEDVTAKAGLAGTGFDIGVAVADFNNDGYKDLFVAGVYRSTLYRNNGDGTFTDITAKAGLAKPDERYGRLWGVAAAWLDFDGDGLLDLFVVNYCIWDAQKEIRCETGGKPDYCHPKNYQGLPNSLYRNNGDGTFTDVSASSGIRKYVGRGMSAAVADYDGDGRPDIFVTNDKLFNFLFHNEGAGKFSEMAFDAGVAATEDGNPVSGMGVDFRDINNDGLPDLFFTALPDETFPLYLNAGKARFDEATHASRLSLITRKMAGWGAGIYDFDNDGWKDIFVARSEVLSPDGSRAGRARQPNSVLRNLANGKMEDATESAGLLARPPMMHRGVAFGDFNRDGRIDAVVTSLGAEAELWINASPSANHWLDLDLVGTRSNKDAVGARVKLVTRKGSQFNHVSTAVGYASSSAGPVHFGMGAETQAERIEITWPSGIVQAISAVPADQVLRVVEKTQ